MNGLTTTCGVSITVDPQVRLAKDATLRKPLAAIVLAASTLGAAGGAQAGQTSFNFSVGIGQYVQGTIGGLMSNGNDQHATSLSVTSYPGFLAGGLIAPAYFNIAGATANSFNVTAGIVSYAIFYGNGTGVNSTARLALEDGTTNLTLANYVSALYVPGFASAGSQLYTSDRPRTFHLPRSRTAPPADAVRRHAGAGAGAAYAQAAACLLKGESEACRAPTSCRLLAAGPALNGPACISAAGLAECRMAVRIRKFYPLYRTRLRGSLPHAYGIHSFPARICRGGRFRW